MNRYCPALVVWFVHCGFLAANENVVLLPRALHLQSPASSQRLLVQKVVGQSFTQQVTDGIRWTSSDPRVATVSDGVVTPVANGEALISAVLPTATVTATATVTVSDMDQPFQLTFRNHVLPRFAKLGCNSGACHGALAGKGGFRLSLRGYDPASDYFNIAKQARGRRIELADPGRSLILAKPSGAIPHKGGLRFEADSEDYRVVSKWIAAGASPPTDADPVVTHLTVLPDKSIHQIGDRQQILVRAHFDNGTVEDVTRLVKWSSASEAVCRVNDDGIGEVVGPGEGAIVAWYDSHIAIARLTVPYPSKGLSASTPAAVDPREPASFIDEFVDKQLAQLNLSASPACSDADFVRRAYIDTVGRMPTADEVRQFFSDSSDDKRDALIDRLLACPEFVDYWTYKWSDVLMLNGTLLRPKPLKAYYEEIRGHVKDNTPWDEFVREILLATGDSIENGATNFYALHQSPEDMTENACQAFMGLSIGCAKCHNHPLEKWTNDQYYAVANLFSRVKAKGWGGEPRSGDGMRTLYVSTSGELIQPRTGKPRPPAPLDGEPISMDDPTDRRIHFANWLTSPENPYFARSITNRVWANFFGVGLIESVDDLRVSNPASNEELLAAAAEYVVDNEFNLKPLMKAILQSNAYQRSSQPLESNKDERRFYSRYYPRRMMAEVLHDAIVQVTDVPTKFQWIAFPGADRQKTDFYPEGTRAIQLYDSAVENYFLRTFGRNPRRIVCECERSDEPTIVQVLHISNGHTLNDKLRADKNRIGKLIALRRAGMSDEGMLDEIYLTCLARFPSDKERDRLMAILPPRGAQDEREIAEDILWGIMSSREFLFNH